MSFILFELVDYCLHNKVVYQCVYHGKEMTLENAILKAISANILFSSISK